MRILFLSRWFPYPPDNGAKIRIFNLIKGLAANHTVDLISFGEDNFGQETADLMCHWCENIVIVPYYPFRPNSIKAMIGFFSKKPRSVIDTYHTKFAAAVQEATAHNPYDLLIASQIDMAVYGESVRGVRKILEELEVTKISRPYYAEKNVLRKLRLGLTWWKLAGYIRTLMSSYDGCTVVSEIEQSAVKDTHSAIFPAVIPNGVDIVFFRPSADVAIDSDALIYNGAITYSVNFDAVAYFIREVFPLILAERPSAHFYVTGKADSALIRKLPRHEQVVFTGYLSDIRPNLLRSSVNVIPILTGGGTRLKILESLAAGIPVVSTSAGAEGLNLVPGRDILIADEPQQFAQAVLQLLKDESLRALLRKNGREFVENHYDWCVIHSQFETYIAQVMQSRPFMEKA